MKSKLKIALLATIPIPVVIILYVFLFTFTLQGKVVDKYSGKPLGNIGIPLSVRTITTDKNGNYSISFARKGFSFKVSKKDYETKKVVLNSNSPANINLRPTTLAGKVIDAYTKQPIENVQITYGEQEVKTDHKGSYKLSDVPEKINLAIQAPSKKYETLEAKIIDTAKKDFRINLKPPKALEYITSLSQAKQYGLYYYFVHSDIKRLINKKQAVKLLQKSYKETEKLGIYNIQYKTGNFIILNKWHSDATNKAYRKVVEIQQTKTGNTPIGKMSFTKAVHLIKENGIWTWTMNKEAISEAKKL